MKTIDAATIEYASLGNIDPNGKVFFWEDGVYRAINNDKAPFYRAVLEKDRINKLHAAGLIGTRVADITLSGHSLTVQHERVPVISYVTEWSASMLKAAALVTLQISLELERNGMQLQDAHPWNVLFIGSNAKFIDFTSIIEIRDSSKWTALDEFICTFLHPLKMMSEGSESVARRALVDWKKLRGRKISKRRAVVELLKQGKVGAAIDFTGVNYRSVGHGIRSQIEGLLEQVDSIPVRFDDTAWSDYCDEEVDLNSFDEWMVKRKTVAEVLDRCKPVTLLDIGCNTGWFSKLAALKGSQTVAFDLDEPSINQLFENPVSRQLNILPLIVDFIDPPPAYGIDLRCKDAYERFLSEFVLGLAIVHHLVFKQGQTFETIVEIITKYTTRWLLIEFIPREDKYVWKYFKRWPSYHKKYDWYTRDNFLRALEKRFTKIEILPSNPEPRVLILCER
jgi:ribosomal protein L11 methylase PrmA